MSPASNMASSWGILMFVFRGVTEGNRWKQMKVPSWCVFKIDFSFVDEDPTFCVRKLCFFLSV